MVHQLSVKLLYLSNKMQFLVISLHFMVLGDIQQSLNPLDRQLCSCSWCSFLSSCYGLQFATTSNLCWSLVHFLRFQVIAAEQQHYSYSTNSWLDILNKHSFKLNFDKFFSFCGSSRYQLVIFFSRGLWLIVMGVMVLLCGSQATAYLLLWT